MTDDNNRLDSMPLPDGGRYDFLYDNENNRESRKRYNAAGTLTEEFVYKWDHRNRLTEVQIYDDTGTETKRIVYTYDVYDRRISRQVGEADTSNPPPPGGGGPGGGSSTGGLVWQPAERYVYDSVPGSDLDHVVLTLDGGDFSVGERYLHGPIVDQFFAQEDEVGNVLWALADNQGTVRDLAGYDGISTTTVNHIEYDSFGNITSQSDPTLEPAFSYTGREWDADAELYYYRARYYDPVAGRFISEDPIGFSAGDANLSRLVGNGMPNATDPSGLQSRGSQWSQFVERVQKDGAIIRWRGGQYHAQKGISEGVLKNFITRNEGVAAILPDGTIMRLEAGNNGSPTMTKLAPIPKEFTPAGAPPKPEPAPVKSAIVREGEDWRLFYIFAFNGKSPLYVVRKVPSATEAVRHGMTPTNLATKLHPIEHCLGEHLTRPGKPTPYLSASRLPKGAPNITGQPVWIDVNKLKNKVHTFDDIVKMSRQFLSRNAHLQARFDMWARAGESEWLIEGKVPPDAVLTRNGVRLRTTLRVGGKLLTLYAIAMDTSAFFEAEDKAGESARIAGGWTGAWAMGKAGSKLGATGALLFGQAGPQAAAPEEVVTIPVAGTIGGLVGGFLGYWMGSKAGRNYYDFIKANCED